MVMSGALSKAARHGDLAQIRAYFSAGGRDADERDARGWPLLCSAALHGKCAAMRVLLEYGASTEAGSADVQYDSETPLHQQWASYDSETPLHWASLHGHLDAAALLLDRGARVDSSSTMFHHPLMFAAWNGHCDIVRLLLSRGAVLDARNYFGHTADGWAVHNNQRDAAALLADVRRAGGWTAYARVPRERLLALRALCARGRARTEDAVLARLFPWRPAAGRAPRTRLRARAEPGRAVPAEIFWLVLAYWRADRDARY